MLLNPKTTKEALSIVYNQLNDFEYILLQGNGLFGNEPKVLSIAIGYWNNRIVMHLLDEKQVTVCTCDINNTSLIQKKMNWIIKCYQINIENIGFITDSTTKEIAEFAYHRKKQIFKILSVKTGEHSVSVSYSIKGRITVEKLIQLNNSYQNFLDTIYEDSDIQVIIENIPPITLIRMRKLKEIGLTK